ncbi:undecaprenyl-phosphate glucose phosphotransferase [Clostridium sp. OS1-26]|uniref:undecaprenyl-phosphate glucose phosphotransferase n=1 Tax=Clostridium sp. OS1-26 TaxID=3070681 RepID=UPI0027DFCD42|nr:undecaprenyl-phosphate glucose phosphotransferase [Clostridium sp. OS1-26]WML36773.1 undecaprenyl-phosphate glucose phosphotransferase [Clostridium sp. OS1-26]
MIRQNQKYFNVILVIIDALTLLIAIKIAWYIRFNLNILSKAEGNYPLERYFVPLACMIPVYLGLYSLFKLYTPHRYKGIIKEVINLIKANILGILLFIMMLYLFKEINYSRYMIATFLVVGTMLSCLERCFLRGFLRLLRKKGYNLKHVIFVGVNDCTFDFMNKIKSNKHWGYNVVGVFSDILEEKKFLEQQEVYSEVAAVLESNMNILGSIKSIEEYLGSYPIDEVFITLPFSHYKKLNWVIAICEKNGIKAQIIPEFSKFLSSRPYIEDIDGTAIISMRYIPLDSVLNKAIKRAFDIICSSLSIIIFSPVMLLCTVIIKITSPGPIIFKQERVGLNKKNFNMYKFRSMHIQRDEEEKVQWTTVDDPRKTKFGSFIRKTSIDELPQLFNVLKGDMSLVGPRPERPYFVDKFKEEIPKYMVKHQVRPGITGWAQVNGWRGDTSIEKRIECDIYYIENWNLWLDIKILFLTVFKGFVNRNAY